MENQTEFTFACPHCGQHLAADTDMAGMELECPSCGKSLQVPSEPPAQRETPKLRVVPPSDEVPPEKGDFAGKAKTALANAAARTREAAAPILHAVKERWTATTPKNKKRIAIAAVCIVALCILIPRMAGSKRTIHGDGQQAEVLPRPDIKPLKTQSKTEAYRAKCIEIKYEDVMRHPGQFMGKDVCIRVKVHNVIMADPKKGNHRGGVWASTDKNDQYSDPMQWGIVYDDERTAFPDGNVLKGDYATVYGVFDGIGHWSRGDYPRIMARMISTAPAEQAERESAVVKGTIANPQPPVPAQEYPASSQVLPPDPEEDEEENDHATAENVEQNPAIIDGVAWSYAIEDGEAHIQGDLYGKRKNDRLRAPAISDATSGAITVPSTLGGCPVTQIGEGAFQGCSGLMSVTIPNRVIRIGEGAFQGCSGLMSVTIPNGVTRIGKGAFEGCSGLTSVTIPNSVTDIDSSAFYGCASLTSVKIPDSVTDISYSVFKGCNDALFDTKTIPGLKLVDGWAVGCESSLSGNLDLKSVRGIGAGAFKGCSGLTSVTIPNGVAGIGSKAFKGCGGLKSVTIPKGVVGIGYGAFEDCTSLAAVTMPNGVTSIEESTFEGCTSLASVTIPSSVKSIGRSAFEGCTSLSSVRIPKGVTSIGREAFKGCSQLTEVTIPDSVKSIDFFAFEDCKKLVAKIDVPDIALWATNTINKRLNGARRLFVNGKEVVSITIPNGVTSIGDYAFEDCTQLTSVTIPSSVKSIGRGAFWGCTGLTSVKIPDGVKSIGDYAFASCSGLSSVRIPYGVKSIGEYAFGSCTGLTSVMIPNGIKWIEKEAFCGCKALTSIAIPDSVTSVGEKAFSKCYELADISIPSQFHGRISTWELPRYCKVFVRSPTATSMAASRVVERAERQEYARQEEEAQKAEEQARRMQKGMAVLGMLSQLGAVAAQQDAAAKRQQEEARRQADALDNWTDAIPSPQNQKPSWEQPQGQPQVQPRERQQQKEVYLCPKCRGTGRLGAAGQALDVPGALTTGQVQPCQFCRGTGVVDRRY